VAGLLDFDSKQLDALLDEFAYRFFQELDYCKECENGIKIKSVRIYSHINQMFFILKLMS